MPTKDISDFWRGTLSGLAGVPMDAVVEPWEPLSDRTLTASRVILTSYGGVRIRGWYFVPEGPTPRQGWPGLLTVPGYSGNLNLPQHLVRFGYCVLALYPRGQGESTAEWQVEEATKLTSHLTDRNHYYYRAAYMDCVRGLDFLCARPEVDAARIGMFGASQGGGLTFATASLDQRVRAAVAWIPFLCNFPLAATITTAPYAELGAYLAEHPDEQAAVFETLRFFDSLSLVDAITVPVLVGVGGRDVVCPEATVMPVFQRIETRKTLVYLPDLEHGYSVEYAIETKLWLDRYLS